MTIEYLFRRKAMHKGYLNIQSLRAKYHRYKASHLNAEQSDRRPEFASTCHLYMRRATDDAEKVKLGNACHKAESDQLNPLSKNIGLGQDTKFPPVPPTVKRTDTGPPRSTWTTRCGSDLPFVPHCRDESDGWVKQQRVSAGGRNCTVTDINPHQFGAID